MIGLSNLGDCLLHLDHHEMTEECWSVVLDVYMGLCHRGIRRGPDRVDAYKALYERALLAKMVAELTGTVTGPR